MLEFALGGVELMALADAYSLGLLPCRVLALIFLLVAFAAAGDLIGYSACYKHPAEKPLTAGRTMRACARAYKSTGETAMPRCRGSLKMNEEKLLIEFLKLYLDGLDKVSNYDAVRVGIEKLLSEGVFIDGEELSIVLSIVSGIKISAERLQGMAVGRVIYMHPAIPAK
ncbi:MAG: hypothetical protein V8T38_00045 [Oscillospiraceae bacterium]